jgi:hypothetical protein
MFTRFSTKLAVTAVSAVAIGYSNYDTGKNKFLFWNSTAHCDTRPVYRRVDV